MNTTTNTRGVKYTPEQVERQASILSDTWGVGEAYKMLRAYAAALSAPEPAAQGDAVADECPHEWVDYVQAEYKPRHRVFEPGESNVARYVRIGLMCTTCGKEKPAPATPPAQPAEAYFPDANALADWLESLHECRTDGAVGNRKWEVAQIAAKAVRGAAQPAERVPEGWREAFEDCYMRANEVGILHRDDDGEYTSAFTKVAWALWNERACFSPIYWWRASRDDDHRTWTVHSPSGDSCEVHERAAGAHAEILRQLAQDLTASPAPSEGGKGVDRG